MTTSVQRWPVNHEDTWSQQTNGWTRYIPAVPWPATRVCVASSQCERRGPVPVAAPRRGGQRRHKPSCYSPPRISVRSTGPPDQTATTPTVFDFHQDPLQIMFMFVLSMVALEKAYVSALFLYWNIDRQDYLNMCKMPIFISPVPSMFYLFIQSLALVGLR